MEFVALPCRDRHREKNYHPILFSIYFKNKDGLGAQCPIATLREKTNKQTCNFHIGTIQWSVGPGPGSCQDPSVTGTVLPGI